MKLLVSKIKPEQGFAYVAHLVLSALLPVAVYVLVQIELVQVALLLILLSKWRMVAVQPRFWWAHLRANAVDILVGLSILAFLVNTTNAYWQLAWMVVYILWLLLLKPRNSIPSISLQAFVAHIFGFSALYIVWGDAPLIAIVLASWFIAYMTARHFFTSFDERYTALFSHFWGYFAAVLTWVLGHYLLFYGVLAQPTLMLTVIGYGLGALYYLKHHDRLTTLVRREFIFIMIAILLIVLVLADWSDPII